MSDPITDDCSSGLHEYCTPCECECHTPDSEKLAYKITNKIFDKLIWAGVLKNSVEREEFITNILDIVMNELE